MFKFAVLAALVACVAAIDIPFDTCSGLPGPTSLNVPECDSLPCQWSAGDEFTANIVIETTGPVENLFTIVTITHNGFERGWPLPNGDACYALASGSCPLTAGEHTISFPVVLEGLPTGESTIRVDITDEAGNHVACGSVTTTIDE